MITSDHLAGERRHRPGVELRRPDRLGGRATRRPGAQLKSYLDFFEARYGPYPGNSIGLVVDNVSSTGINYALETQDRPFFPGSVGTSTTIHEVMHQWFGDNVSPGGLERPLAQRGPGDVRRGAVPQRGRDRDHVLQPVERHRAGQRDLDDARRATRPTRPVGPLRLARLRPRRDGARGAPDRRSAPTTFADLMEEWQVRYGGESPGTAAFIALAEELVRPATWTPSSRTGSTTTTSRPGRASSTSRWPRRPAVGPVSPGSALTYTLSVTNTGKVSLAGAVVTLDLTDVLDDATRRRAARRHGARRHHADLDGACHRAGRDDLRRRPVHHLGRHRREHPRRDRAGLDARVHVHDVHLDAVGADNPVSPTAVPTIDDTTPKVGRR